MSTTYEQLEKAHFEAFTIANSTAKALTSLFVGRRVTSLTDEEWQAIAPLFSSEPLPVIDAHRLVVDDDGVITLWLDSPEGQMFLAGIN